MNMPDDPPPSPDHARVPGAFCADPPPKSTLTMAGRPKSDLPAPSKTALRRRRLQMVRQLRVIARLQEQVGELRAEISSLESIIGAQADALDALRRQKQDPQD